MKLSVIFGVAQMSLGVCMKAFNAYYDSSYIDFIFEFIPQIVLLLSLFGYMNVLIIVKWLTDYTGRENVAPSIINTMINIPLKGAEIEGQPFFSDMPTNQSVSLILLLIAVICIPVMLLPKPLIMINRIKDDHSETHSVDFDSQYPYQEESKEVNDENGDGVKYQKLDDGPADEEFKRVSLNDEKRNTHTQDREALPVSRESNSNAKFNQKANLVLEGPEEHHSGSEIFIHQLIETIEFVLGTISNTASYLRLWALSLAHSQLAGVFFELTLWVGIKAQNPIAIFIGFLVFGSASFAVLM